MPNRLDKESRDILEFRPNIAFVEPEVVSVAPTPVPAPLESSAIKQEVDQTVALAKAVDTLAAAVQARADLRAEGMVIALHPGADDAAIAAMRRLYPGDNPNEINYDQYRNCKDQQLEHGVNVAKNAVISEDEIKEAKEDPLNTNQIAGFGSADAANGSLRPELNSRAQLVPVLDMKETQDLLIRHFANFVWKSFIKPIIPLPFLPDKIAKVPKNSQAEQFIGAAEASAKVPKVETGKVAASALQSAQKGTDSESLTGFAAKAPKDGQPFKFYDCQTITKTFERAAHFCTTEESVFAMLTPTLLSMRASAQGFLVQAKSNEDLTGVTDAIKDQIEDNEAVREKEKDKLAEWLLDCIPCLERMSMGPIAFDNIWDQLWEQLKAIKDQFIQQLEQLKEILNFFNFEDQYIDLCMLKKFFFSFVCLPDLRRLIAALMALLMKLALELTAFFDIVLGLIAPIITPFLGAIINLVTQFIMMIVKPINCIIDSLINMLGKADWNELFNATGNFNISIGSNIQGPHNFSIGIPFTDKKIVDVDLDIPRIPKIDINLHEGLTKAVGWPFYSMSEHMEAEQATVDAANAKLNEIRKKMGSVDFRDTEQKKKYYQELEKAKSELREAINEKETSAAQRRQQDLRKLKEFINSFFTKIIMLVREIVEAIEQWFTDLVEEFKKLLGDILGANTNITIKLFKKLEIIKIIAAIIALVAALSKPVDCEEVLDNVDTSSLLPTRQGLTVVTDEYGNISIIEDPEAVESAMDDLAAAMSPDRPRQNLKSLIEFTGDPVLDSEIARIADQVERPTSITYRCPLITTVAASEKINEWMKDLDNA